MTRSQRKAFQRDERQRRRKGPTPKREWTPMRLTGEANLPVIGELNDVWVNPLYVVHVREQENGVTHLSIRNVNRGARHDWREFQRIKNDICGPEREAVELYPAESRLTDTANQFHLWVAPEGARFPFGWDAGRRVAGQDEDAFTDDELRAAGYDPDAYRASTPNAKQRGL